MAKLRKLLEDVHTESEQQIHILRQKHQTAMMELQVSRSQSTIANRPFFQP